MSSSNVYPVFAQSFISHARFATNEEIHCYMKTRAFEPMPEEGCFENEEFILSGIKPKNVLNANQTIFVIDAEIQMK